MWWIAGTTAQRWFRLIGICALLAASVIGVAAESLAAELSGTPVIVDGRTVDLDGARLRLAGIEVPDLAQKCRKGRRWIECGVVSASQLADITAGAERVVCLAEPPGADGIRIAKCKADGYDLAGGMVYAGWALAEGAPGRRYRAREEAARADRRGIWRYEFVPPGDWRNGRRLPATRR